MKRDGRGAVLATVVGIVFLGLVAGRCAPSAPKGAKKSGAVSDVAQAAMKVYVAPGDLERVLGEWEQWSPDAKPLRIDRAQDCLNHCHVVLLRCQFYGRATRAA
jgi:hypothetical protein